jgi:hypothetical protein
MVTAHGIEVAWFYRRERESECCGTRMEAAEEAAATKEEEEEEELCAREDLEMMRRVGRRLKELRTGVKLFA